MSGLPANDRKAAVIKFWQALESTDDSAVLSCLERLLDKNTIWHAHQPVGDIRGSHAIYQQLWKPIRESFSDLQREVFILFEGLSNGRVDGDQSLDGKHWVTGTGVFHGRFEHPYCGIPATGEQVQLRWGEFCRFDNDRIAEVYFLVDLIDLLEQSGNQVLPVCTGKPFVYLPPADMDGVIKGQSEAAESAYSLAHIRQFIFEGLNAYDKNNLRSMGMADYFHPDVQWYGPGGIGLCDGFEAFETLHQKPWLQAFPDRRVQDLNALIAEGVYSAAPGWAGVLATHQGSYLGCAATGNPVSINGLDWWKRKDEQYIENWVFVDMVHLFKQMGVDLLAKART